MLARFTCRRVVEAFAREPRRISIVTAAPTRDGAMARAIESTIESRFDDRLAPDRGPIGRITHRYGVQIQPCVLVEECLERGYAFERFYPLA
jgi:hypothetical protein